MKNPPMDFHVVYPIIMLSKTLKDANLLLIMVICWILNQPISVSSPYLSLNFFFLILGNYHLSAELFIYNLDYSHRTFN